MQYSVVIISALAGFSAALTQPNTANGPEGNAITAPLNQIVPAGKPFTIKWTPTTKGDVSLVLLKGDSKHAVPIQTIVDSIPNVGSYVWVPDSSLAPTDGPTGYGIELIVEGTGQYQYSTQIGISAAEGPKPNSASASTSAKVETASATVTVPCNDTKSAATTMRPAATGTSNYTAPVLSPTGPMSVPTSLASVATASGSKPSASASAKNGSDVHTAGAAGTSAQLTGALVAAFGLISYFAL